MKGYFYITKNLINGRFYYGTSTVGNEKKYFGSSPLLEKAIKKYGKENFEHTPLKYFETREKAFMFEDRFLKLYKISNNSKSYNLKDAALGGDTLKNNPKKESIIKKRNKKVSQSLIGHSVSSETRKKQSIKHKGWLKKLSQEKQNEYKNKISNTLKNKYKYTDHPSKGKKLSTETKELISKIAKERGFGGDKWSHLTSEERKIRSKKLSESRKGRKLSEQTKQKIREALLNSKLSEERKKKISNTLKKIKTNGTI
jgi:hypothetical protein